MTPTARAAWREHGPALALALAWLAATAWARPLLLPDEGRYVGVAWEMMRSGDWLTPTLNGLPYFHKPPLFYWVTAASMSLLGLNEWAARVAPLLGAAGAAIATYAFVLRWVGTRAAGMTLLALLVQPLFYLGGQFANLDMAVAGCITATVLLLADAALCAERGRPYRRALAAAYVMAALGVLAKGLIGMVIPALVILAWLPTLGREPGLRALRALLWLPGMLAFLLLATPWFVAMQWQYPGFLHYFVVVQHIQRFASGAFNNPQPAWFFPAVLLLFTLPWLPWLRPLLARQAWSDTLRGPVRRLMLVWLTVVVVFFSLPQSKLIGYVLPAVPPLAALIADGALGLGNASARARRLWWASVALGAVVNLAAVAWLTLHPLHSTRELALVLRAERQAHEPVFMLGEYGFDVPFYARLAAPVGVVDEWSNPELHSRDNWRKELADAGRFAPARAATTLIEPAAWPAALCAAPRSWLIGPSEGNPAAAVVGISRVVFSRRGTSLWQVDLGEPRVFSALGCAEKPNVEPADR